MPILPSSLPRNHDSPNESVISRCQFLSGLGQDQIKKLAAMSVPRNYAAGESIFRQGDACPGLFVVDQGLVRVFRSGAGGGQHVLHLCGPGQTFAEVAVFADFDLPANAIAVQPTQCLLIPTDELQNELAANHQLCRDMLGSMAFWTRHFVQLLDDIVLRDATERVARFLCDAPCDSKGHLKLPGSKKDVANHLNIASETFSRVLRRLCESEVLENRAGQDIRVINAAQLSQLAVQAPKTQPIQ
ncbi:Crp/Fnr family transcriptional regulator [Rubripirellula lacrimiformis]|nr:Crp/Fnr family transcriptional regulator [Rubripirellula lacrimiformis]